MEYLFMAVPQNFTTSALRKIEPPRLKRRQDNMRGRRIEDGPKAGLKLTFSTTPITGDLFGEAREPEGGVAFRGLKRGQLGEAVNLGVRGFRFFANNYRTGEAEAGNSQLKRVLRDLPDAFAHQSGWVNGAFTRDDQVRPANPALQAGVADKQIKSRFQTPAQKTTQAKTQAARRARAGFIGVIAAKVFFDNPGEAAQATFCQRTIRRGQPFLRAINPRATARAQQRILHVHGNQKLTEPAGSTRPPQSGERMKRGPFCDRFSGGIEKSPAERASDAEPAIIGRAAANAH